MRSSASIFTSTSGPTSRNATIEPGVNVEANDSAKNESTFEQIDTIIASRIIATIDSAGFDPIASSAERGTSTCTAPASADPMMRAGMTARSSTTNWARLRRPRSRPRVASGSFASSQDAAKRSVTSPSGSGCLL